MSTIDEQFSQAKLDVKTLRQKPSNEVLLSLYSLYKQGSEGDVHMEKPGVFDFVAKAKYNAWEQLKGMSQTEAQEKYVEMVQHLLKEDQTAE